MHRTVQELQAIAASGGGLTLDARALSVQDLQAIASSASNKGARITIVGASQLTTQQLQAIGASGKGAVAFTEV